MISINTAPQWIPASAAPQQVQTPQFGYKRPTTQMPTIEHNPAAAPQAGYVPKGFSRVSQNGMWNNAIARNNGDVSQTNTGQGINRLDIASGDLKSYQTGGFHGIVNNQGPGYLNAVQENSTWGTINHTGGGAFDITQKKLFGAFGNVTGGGTLNQTENAYSTAWVSGEHTGATVNQNKSYNGTVYTSAAGVTVNQEELEHAAFVQNKGGGTFKQKAGYQNIGFVSDAGGNYTQIGQHNAFQAERSGVKADQTGASSIAYLIDSGSELAQQGGDWATAYQQGGGSKIFQGNQFNDGFIMGGSSTIDQGSATAYRNRLVNTGDIKFSQNAVADNIVWNNGGGIDGSQVSSSGVNWAVL